MLLGADSNMYRSRGGCYCVSPVVRWLFFRLVLSFLKELEKQVVPVRWAVQKVAWEKHCGAKLLLLPRHITNDPPVEPHACSRLWSCSFDINIYFLNEECYLTSQRVMKTYCILYTCKCIFYIFASICVQVCSIFQDLSHFWGGLTRSGIVSLFTCVTTVFLSKHKTNLVPSFLPAPSGSTCVISLAEQYNTSVVQRLESDSDSNSAESSLDGNRWAAVLSYGFYIQRFTS